MVTDRVHDYKSWRGKRGARTTAFARVRLWAAGSRAALICGGDCLTDVETTGVGIMRWGLELQLSTAYYQVPCKIVLRGQ